MKIKEYLKESESISESNSDTYTWEQINQAMMQIGFGPKVIVKLLMAISKIKKGI